MMKTTYLCLWCNDYKKPEDFPKDSTVGKQCTAVEINPHVVSKCTACTQSTVDYEQDHSRWKKIKNAVYKLLTK